MGQCTSIGLGGDVGAGTANGVVMGLGEGVQRWVLVTEGGTASQAGRGPPTASLYSLGSDTVSRTVAHQLNLNQALIQGLAVKDLALAKSSERIYWIGSHHWGS